MLVGLVHLLLSALSVVIVSKFLPGIRVKSYGSAVAFAFAVAILDAIVYFFLAPLSWPFAIVTMGLGFFVLNGLVFVVADKLIDGIEIAGFGTAMLASICVSAVNWAMHFVFGRWAP
jgi:putative membrane protein